MMKDDRFEQGKRNFGCINRVLYNEMRKGKHVTVRQRFTSFLFLRKRGSMTRDQEQRRTRTFVKGGIDYRVEDNAVGAGHTINIKSSSIAT